MNNFANYFNIVNPIQNSKMDSLPVFPCNSTKTHELVSQIF